LAETKKPIIISTGASTFTEIDFAIDILRKKYNENVCILQCTSKYPCPLESLNLSVIPTLKSRYNLPVGLSDHSTDPVISPIMALGYGAKIIEKHFTLDRNLPGPDHPFALIPSELELLVKTVRESEKTIGNGKKEVLEIENELRQFATRSLQAIKNISKGEILKEGVNFDVLRPGNRIRGFDARFLDKINGKKASKNFLLGDGITEYE
jgi:N-acetylneuraminate synthase